MFSIAIVIAALFFGAISVIAGHGWLVLAALALAWVACVITDLHPGALGARLRAAAAAHRPVRRGPSRSRRRAAPARSNA
jgi:hypothetical protein